MFSLRTRHFGDDLLEGEIHSVPIFQIRLYSDKGARCTLYTVYNLLLFTFYQIKSLPLDPDLLPFKSADFVFE